MKLGKKIVILVKQGVVTGSGILIVSTMLVNVLNFIFNAYLSRVLSFADFGLVVFINTLVALIIIFVGAISSTVTHRTAFLATKVNMNASLSFARITERKVLLASLLLTVLWIILIPVSAKFFNIGNYTSLIFFTPIIILSMNAAIFRGYLQGNVFLWQVAIVLVLEALSKVIFAVLFKLAHLEDLAYLSIPLSIFVVFVGMYCVFRLKTNHSLRKKIKKINRDSFAFPRRFLAASAISGLATSGFLTLDLVLVRHFFLPSMAGEYALLSLAGKMIYFFGTLFNVLLLTFVSRELGKGKDASSTFYKFLLITTAVTVGAYICVGLLGGFFMPVIFGEKAAAIIPYLGTYGLAISLFTVSNIFVTYHLAKHHYSFSIIVLLTSFLMIVGIYLFHANILQITQVILFTSIFNFICVSGFHLIKKDGKFMLRALIDLGDIFSSIPNQHKYKKNSARILIFNWRDTKHKYAGGAEVYIHELAKRWVRMGHSVTQFCGNDGHSVRNEVVDNVQIVRRGGFYFVYFWAFLYYVLRFRGKYDIIIDCQNGIPFFTPFYAKEKVYCVVHHIHQEIFRRHLNKPSALLASFLENRVMPWTYRNTKFITVSPSTKRSMRDLDLIGSGIEIVYNGVDLRKLTPGKKSKLPTILYIGRLQAYKSVDVLIKAFKLISKTFPQSKLIIAGTGEEEGRLQHLIDMDQLNNIEFKGKVSESEKVSLMQKAWVFVNPSYIEGWGITSIEASACGTPVVASDVPGLRDSVKNPTTGFLVEYGNPRAFALKILELIKNSDLRIQMQQESVEWAKKFEWRKSAKKSLAIIL